MKEEYQIRPDQTRSFQICTPLVRTTIFWFWFSSEKDFLKIILNIYRTYPQYKFTLVGSRNQMTNYETFFSSLKLCQKFENFKYFTGRDITPLDICHSNISVKSPVRGEISLLKPHPFLAHGHIMKRFCPFCTRIYIISTAFLRV